MCWHSEGEVDSGEPWDMVGIVNLVKGFGFCSTCSGGWWHATCSQKDLSSRRVEDGLEGARAAAQRAGIIILCANPGLRWPWEEEKQADQTEHLEVESVSLASAGRWGGRWRRQVKNDPHPKDSALSPWVAETFSVLGKGVGTKGRFQAKSSSFFKGQFVQLTTVSPAPNTGPGTY